jgi:hypothetical protein
MDGEQAGHNKTATSRKLDWLDALNADPAVRPFAFKVGFAIAKHVNARTGEAMVSDETISDITSISMRHVRAGRELLKARRWISWKRTRTANVYRLLSTNVNNALDLLILRRDARRERRAKRMLERHPSASLNHRDRQPSAELDRQRTAEQDRQPSADIHLRGTP